MVGITKAVAMPGWSFSEIAIADLFPKHAAWTHLSEIQSFREAKGRYLGMQNTVGLDQGRHPFRGNLIRSLQLWKGRSVCDEQGGQAGPCM